jgi:ferredoxin-type protein NapH
MQAATTNASNLLVRHRYWILLLGILLFLPPLSFLFQLTQDSNFCGTWCPRMFMVWRKGMTWGGFLQGSLRAYMGVLLVLGVLLTTLFLGRHWCSHVCPIGGTMELGSRIVPRRLKIDYSGIPASYFRYGYLSVFFIAPGLGIGSLCCNYCNFATIPRMFGATFSEADMAYFLRTAGMVNLGLVLALGFFSRGGRAYCNLICPLGALDAIVGRLGMKLGKRVVVDGEKCNGCGLCLGVCPTWAIAASEKATIDQLSCMPCRLCEKSCPLEAIRYEKSRA